MLRTRNYVAWGVFFLGIVSPGLIAEQNSISSAGRETPVQVFITASGPKLSTTILSAPELGVSIDNKPAQVSSLRSAKEDKLLFAMLVDMSRSEQGNAETIKKTAMQIFQALSTPENQGYVVFFSQRVVISKEPLRLSDMLLALNSIHFAGGTVLFDAIQEVCTRVLKRSANPEFPRRAIILLSDGGDNSSHISPIQAKEIAQEEGVSVFSLSEDSVSERQGRTFLKEISRATGGQAISAQNLQEGATSLLSAVHEQWVLELIPPPLPDLKLHTLRIKSLKKDVDLSVPAKIAIHW